MMMRRRIILLDRLKIQAGRHSLLIQAVPASQSVIRLTVRDGEELKRLRSSKKHTLIVDCSDLERLVSKAEYWGEDHHGMNTMNQEEPRLDLLDDEKEEEVFRAKKKKY